MGNVPDYSGSEIIVIGVSRTEYEFSSFMSFFLFTEGVEQVSKICRIRLKISAKRMDIKMMDHGMGGHYF